jgi:hypothetical protein
LKLRDSLNSKGLSAFRKNNFKDSTLVGVEIIMTDKNSSQKQKDDKMIDKLTLMCLRGQELSSVDDTDVLLDKILETSTEITSASASSIILMDRATKEFYFRAAKGKTSSKVKKLRFDTSKGIAGWVVNNGKPVISNDLENDPRHFSYIDKALNFKTRNLACVPIQWEDETVGVIEVLNKKGKGNFNEQDLEYLTILANQAGSAIYITSMVDKLQNFFINMLEIMMTATETLATSPGHSIKVARLATKIAREMEVSEREYNDIYYASLIHDIGQIKVARNQIVGGERLVPSLGAEMLKPIKMLKDIAILIEHHHERWDGSGHPKGLRGEDIPLGARIIGLAEEYEEWKEQETYRKQFDPTYSDDFFKRILVTYDPDVIDAFKRVRKKELTRTIQES